MPRMLQGAIIDQGLLVVPTLWGQPAWLQRGAVRKPAGVTSFEPLETAVPKAWMVESRAQASWISGWFTQESPG